MISIDMIDEYSKQPEKLDHRRKNEALIEVERGNSKHGIKLENKGKDHTQARRLAVTSQGLKIRIHWSLND
jgi:hypothetical protein